MVKLSLVVISYQMARELPRTLWSLSPAAQRGVVAADYEIIVVDNGSRHPPEAAALAAACPNARLLHMRAPTHSPVRAVNYGLSEASGEIVGVMIDGARLASPGLLTAAIEAAGVSRRPVIGTLGFHLGPKVQMQSVREGYSQRAEDELLDSVRWTENPYRLFAISALAGSSDEGHFAPISESNALFLRAEHWSDLGRYDERFSSIGGGFANLDMWRRAVLSKDARVIMLLGEGTFHQVHGGVATNRPDPPFHIWFDEYRSIRGEEFERPDPRTAYFGEIGPEAMRALEQSVRLAREANSKKEPRAAASLKD